MDEFTDHKLTHHLANFKNFADAEIDISKPLTILIGKNGSGKTNLIESIQVFSHLAEGMPLHKFSDMGKGGYCEVRGGLDNCVRFGADEFELHLNISVGEHIMHNLGDFDYKIKISRTAQHESVLSEESLVLADAPLGGNIGRTLFSTRRNGDMLEVEYDDFTGGKKTSISLAADRSVMSRYEEIIATSTATGRQKKIAPLAVNAISKYLKTVSIFDINPKEMRNYERVTPHAELSRDGHDLSAVLYGLKEKGKSAELENIAKIVRELPEEPFSKMDFIKTSANDVMVRFHVGKGKEKHLLDARMLSDGTLRLLAVLTALETVPEDSRVVIEEFDNGLHPSRARRLVDYLYEAAIRRGLKIFVTTHNPAIMNALSEAEMEIVVLCHRDTKSGHSKLTPLMDIQDVDLMMLRGSLGDLVTGEIVEKYLSSEFRDKREKIAQELVKRYSL